MQKYSQIAGKPATNVNSDDGMYCISEVMEWRKFDSRSTEMSALTFAWEPAVVKGG